MDLDNIIKDPLSRIILELESSSLEGIREDIERLESQLEELTEEACFAGPGYGVLEELEMSIDIVNEAIHKLKSWCKLHE